jgi:pimeloyl-ACP methyl ester carboxylesterase
MSTLMIDGGTVHYSLRGEGPPVALTPGGRVPMAAVRSIADQLAGRVRLFEWDRRNTGASDLALDGSRTEQELWADDLADALVQLDLAPAYIIGGSAGARVSMITAIRHPEVVRGLVLWSVSGGAYGSQVLGYQYHVEYIQAALRGGMEAVAKTPFFAERIEANPSNRERLLAMDPNAFIAMMRYWNEMFYFRDDTPMAGATEEQLRAVDVPALIFEGNDDIHPPEAAEAVHALLPNSEFVPSPWSRSDFMDRLVRKSPGTVFDLYPAMTPTILEWIARTEAARS